MKVVECGSKQRTSQSHTHEATCELHKMSRVRECIDVKSGTCISEPIAVTKCLIKPKEGRFILAHGLRMQSIMLESQDRRQRRQLATLLPVRKQQGMNAGGQLTFFFLFCVHTNPWDCAAHF